MRIPFLHTSITVSKLFDIDHSHCHFDIHFPDHQWIHFHSLYLYVIFVFLSNLHFWSYTWWCKGDHMWCRIWYESYESNRSTIFKASTLTPVLSLKPSTQFFIFFLLNFEKALHTLITNLLLCDVWIFSPNEWVLFILDPFSFNILKLFWFNSVQIVSSGCFLYRWHCLTWKLHWGQDPGESYLCLCFPPCIFSKTSFCVKVFNPL